LDITDFGVYDLHRHRKMNYHIFEFKDNIKENTSFSEFPGTNPSGKLSFHGFLNVDAFSVREFKIMTGFQSISL
jgi:hypothetical protein